MQKLTTKGKPMTHYEQIPVRKVKDMIAGFAEKQKSAPMLPGASPILKCNMCGKPVAVEAAKTDARGQAIHEECCVASVTR